MAISVKLSTGLRNHIATVGSAMAALQNGFIKIYTTPEPATADAAVGAAVLLTTISLDGTGAGLALEGKGGGAFGKPDAAVWNGVNEESGAPVWFRHVLPEDDGTLSVSALRIQGNVGVTDAAATVTAETLGIGLTQSVNSYVVTIPAT